MQQRSVTCFHVGFQLLAGLSVLLTNVACCAQAPSEANAISTDPTPVEIETADGVLLAGTLFAAEGADKDTPVVVMLPDEGESPAVFDRLATRLQQPTDEAFTPMTVLAVALRGQGDSTRVRGSEGVTDRRGARLTPVDVAAMVKADMEAVRQFLVDRNDANELNLNRLAYLGVGLGALVATNAAAVDWSVPQLSRGKQGRDVKSLVLVSPPWKQQGLGMLDALRQPGVQSEVAVLLTYGGESRTAVNDAERIVRQLEKGRPPMPEVAEGETALLPTVVDAPGESRLQGTAWLKQAGRDGETAIARFLQRTLADPDLPRAKRRLD